MSEIYKHTLIIKTFYRFIPMYVVDIQLFNNTNKGITFGFSSRFDLKTRGITS